MCPAKTLLSLGIHPVWSVFTVCMKKPWFLCYSLSTQRRLIRLGKCSGWSESLLGAQVILLVCHVAAKTLHSLGLVPCLVPLLFIKHTAQIDQTGQMPRLVRVFAGCTGHFVGLSCGGLVIYYLQKLKAVSN